MYSEDYRFVVDNESPLSTNARDLAYSYQDAVAVKESNSAILICSIAFPAIAFACAFTYFFFFRKLKKIVSERKRVLGLLLRIPKAAVGTIVSDIVVEKNQMLRW
jgi:phosphate/sulfate permease